jgi:Tfp pilus assembly protein PilX
MKQEGFILVTVLLFLLVLALLSVSALSNSQLQLRMSNNFSAELQELQTTETGLHAGERQLLQLTHDALPKENYLQPWTAKQYFTIRYNQTDVHYIIEPLTGIACLAMPNNQTQQGAYYRITAWTIKDEQQPFILQSTYARPIDGNCTTGERLLQPGRLSWRELLGER